MALLFCGGVEVTVRQKLNEARRWLTWDQFIHNAAWAVVGGVALVFLVRVMGVVSPDFYALPSFTYVIAFGMPFLVAVAAAVLSWRSLDAVAREIDVRAQTRDRFVTALGLPQEGGHESFGSAAQKEVAAYVSRLDLKKYVRLSNPGKKLLWLLLPLAGIGGVESYRVWREAQLGPELIEARQIVEKARGAAQKRADKNEEIQQAANDLKIALERLPGSDEPMRDALRALAELEQKLASTTSAGGELQAGEAAALAEALASQYPQLASDLRTGNNAAAAESIAQLNPETLARALEEAARHRENTRLRELSQSQLMAMLQSKGSGQSGSERRKFLSELSDIRTGNSESGEEVGKDGQPGEGPDGKERTAASDADNAPPGGAPGSEKDLGRGSDLAGEGQSESKIGANDDFISGKQGEGGSLVEIFSASGNDDPIARQAYRSAYQSALPAALDAVEQEEIPSGSRLLVRRYFEAIRPKE